MSTRKTAAFGSYVVAEVPSVMPYSKVQLIASCVAGAWPPMSVNWSDSVSPAQVLARSRVGAADAVVARGTMTPNDRAIAPSTARGRLHTLPCVVVKLIL